MRIPRQSPLLLAVLFLSSMAWGQSRDARNLGMGGTGVASSDYTAAAVANPALLTRFDEGDDLAFTIPSISFLVADNDDLLQGLKDFQDSYDDVRAKLGNATITPGDLLGLSNQLLSLNGRAFSATSNVGFRISVPSKGLAWSLFLSGNLDGLIAPRIDATDIARILTSTNPADLDNLMSEVSFVAASVTDLGLSVAHAFEMGGISLGVGVTPKMQRIDTYNYAIQIQNFTFEDFKDARYRSEDTGFNIDAGLSLSFGDSVTLGLSGRNLIARSVDTVVTNGRQYTYELNPLYSVGVAWQPIEMLTLTGDLALNARERFVNRNDDLRYASVGMEIDLWEWLMLRGGYKTDLENVGEDLYTLGVGIGLFDTLRLDAAALFDPNTKTSINGQEYNIYGASIQLTLKF